MGFLQAAKQRVGAAAKTLGRHAATVGKVAVGVAAVAGAAYHAHQSHGERFARDAQANWQAERGRERYENLLKQTPKQHHEPRTENWRGRIQ
jgi:hypothetical protein